METTTQVVAVEATLEVTVEAEPVAVEATLEAMAEAEDVVEATLEAMVEAEDVGRLDSLIDAIGSLEGVEKTVSSILLSSKLQR